MSKTVLSKIGTLLLSLIFSIFCAKEGTAQNIENISESSSVPILDNTVFDINTTWFIFIVL